MSKENGGTLSTQEFYDISKLDAMLKGKGKGLSRTDRKRIAEYFYGECGWTMERIADVFNVTTSIIGIDLNGFVPQGQEPRYKRGRARKSKLTEAKEQAWAQAVLDHGKTLEQVAAEFGLLSVQPVKIAVAREEGRRDAPIDTSGLSVSAQEKLQRAIKQRTRELEAIFEHRVNNGIKEAIEDTVLPHYNKKLEEFDEVIKARKGVLTAEEYRLILSCLHPDQSASPDRIRKAFEIFKLHELSLRSEQEMPTSTAEMPKTYDELIKRREEVRAKRRRQRHQADLKQGIKVI